ncbi:ATP-binding protein [Burkholderia territorii]|uniref:ATP-binding protein n=1 Tax=Burkholderia territorii TaxID=1503055 RepID=UPI001E53520C|nr:winged helix-turn-helix domain-containing protein [Burkholderia territorii]
MDMSATLPDRCDPGCAVIPLGHFELHLGMRALLRDGLEVSLGSRAFDILSTIVLAAGRIVTKDELMESVWPGLFVEENNIHVHLSAVRKALGDHRQLIDTVPGRGYRFMAHERAVVQAARVERADRQRPSINAQVACAARHPLPRRRTLFGRDAALDVIESRFASSRVVTLTGPGGVGKTCVAIEHAYRTAARHAFDVVFVDLAKPGALAAVLRTLDASAQPARTLLVLDNADHVIDGIAGIVERLIAERHSLRVLVTSRERLRIAAETVFRVEPLALPEPDQRRDAMMQSPAVMLFVERASLCGVRVDGEHELRLAAEICRRLDGLPLAIELAAGRAAVFGLEGVCERLEDRFLLLADGYRTAQPRHRTLRAAFDWSFLRLTPNEKTVYLRMAPFGRFFTIDAVFAAACDDTIDRATALDCIAQLVEKSLLDVSFDGAVARYRLSESARAYVLEQLESGSAAPCAHRAHKADSIVRDANRHARSQVQMCDA